jgi:hypothetical protein
MKNLSLATTIAGALAIAGLALAGAATAAPSGSDSAADVVANLQAQGYAVQLNGTADEPLSLCRVTGLHGLPSSGAKAAEQAVQFTTVYVDITCANES